MGIEERLGYQFSDKRLLDLALAHPSLSSEFRPPPPDNQRLEFLGDAVLELTITQLLFEKYPQEKEGQLTKFRASLVSEKALATVARRLEIGPELKLSRGEESNQGRERPSNLADAVEALLGAIFLDSGFQKARQIVAQHWQKELQELQPGIEKSNPKGRLQEILQTEGTQAPTYENISESGPQHARRFRVRVLWKGKPLAEAEGDSKKKAEIAAAAEALKILQNPHLKPNT